MGLLELIERGREAMTVKRVFGDPIERDGLLIIPAAKVRGGGGGGSGEGPEGRGSGFGGGFGLSATPAGAFDPHGSPTEGRDEVALRRFVIRDGDVRWVPAVDWNRAILLGAIVALVLIRALARR